MPRFFSVCIIQMLPATPLLFSLSLLHRPRSLYTATSILPSTRSLPHIQISHVALLHLLLIFCVLLYFPLYMFTFLPSFVSICICLYLIIFPNYKSLLSITSFHSRMLLLLQYTHLYYKICPIYVEKYFLL